MTTEKILEIKSGEEKQAIEQVGNRIAEYGRKLNEYLESIGANVDAYKFAVEKQGDAFIIDAAIKASFRPKKRTSS